MYVRDVQRLRTFALVLDLGSISAAATVLGYTQSAVSQQLAALEREVGTALVDRSQRPLRPTRGGELLRPHAERVPAAVRDLRRAHDDLVVQVLQLETQEAIAQLLAGGADLAVVHHMPGVAVP